jgi:hypothetical protein
MMKETHFMSKRRWLWVVSIAITAIALAGAATVLGSAPTSGAAASSEAEALPPLTGYQAATGPLLTDERIAQIARTEAARASDEAPTMMAINTTMQSALEAEPRNKVVASSAGMEAFMKSAVVLVTLHGHFALDNAPVPDGQPQPSGSVLTLTIDAHSGWVDARELSDALAPGIAALGIARVIQ